MAKKKKNSSRALALPELSEDIQRKIILSLPPKAFGRSSILSKSWLSFYNSTRCSFHFNFQLDTGTVPRRVPQELQQKIMNFDKSLSASLLREKLTVDEFDINMDLSRYYLDTSQHYSDDELADLVYKWLAALFTTNNIVKVLRINIRKSWPNAHVYFHRQLFSKIFSKIFSHESLQVLHLERKFTLDGVYPKNLGCLRVLTLYHVSIDGKSTNRLLTACPNLEQLTWGNSSGAQQIIIKGLHKLKNVDIWGLVDVRIQEAPALENVSLWALNYNERNIINAQVCRRIKLLNMFVNSERTATHIQQIVSRLPALENLILNMGYDTDIRISSSCLKNLQLLIWEDQYLKMVKINAPSLRCYEYCGFAMFIRQLMMKTGMLERVVIDMTNIQIDEPRDVQELRKALRMIEHLKLGVDTVKPGVETVKLDHINLIYDRPTVHVEASRFDEKLNVSATRVIEMLDAGDGKFCF